MEQLGCSFRDFGSLMDWQCKRIARLTLKKQHFAEEGKHAASEIFLGEEKEISCPFSIP